MNEDILKAIIYDAFNIKASDIHIKTNTKIRVRVNGDIVYSKAFTGTISDSYIKTIIQILCFSGSILAKLNALDDYDGRYNIVDEEGNEKSLRVNITACTDGFKIVLRTINADIPQLTDIGYETDNQIIKFIDKQENGLILVTGPTGSGKSTTLAAIINHLSKTKTAHLLTLEDPREYDLVSLENERFIVTSRELGMTVKSFLKGIKSSLRQDPDIILIGELRDMETMAAALELAETGHLIFGTCHVSTAAAAFSRIVNLFPPEERVAREVQMASSMQAILAQRLVKKNGEKGRLALREELLFDAQIRRELMTSREAAIPVLLQRRVEASGRSMLNQAKKMKEQGMADSDEIESILARIELEGLML